MRSTLVLDDELVKKAKQRAAALNTTLSEVVNQALRDALSKPLEEPAPFEMVTYGDPTRPQHREPAELSSLLAEDDIASLRRS